MYMFIVQIFPWVQWMGQVHSTQPSSPPIPWYWNTLCLWSHLLWGWVGEGIQHIFLHLLPIIRIQQNSNFTFEEQNFKQCNIAIIVRNTSSSMSQLCNVITSIHWALKNGGKLSWNSLQTNTDKLTSVIFVYKAHHWALYPLWFQNKFESWDTCNMM